MTHDQGITCHKGFALPLNVTLDAPAVSFIDGASKGARYHRAACAIIIDEVVMLHRMYLECVDELERHVMGTELDKLFAGKVVVTCGDWRQVGT